MNHFFKQRKREIRVRGTQVHPEGDVLLVNHTADAERGEMSLQKAVAGDGQSPCDPRGTEGNERLHSQTLGLEETGVAPDRGLGGCPSSLCAHWRLSGADTKGLSPGDIISSFTGQTGSPIKVDLICPFPFKNVLYSTFLSSSVCSEVFLLLGRARVLSISYSFLRHTCTECAPRARRRADWYQ